MSWERFRSVCPGSSFRCSFIACSIIVMACCGEADASSTLALLMSMPTNVSWDEPSGKLSFPAGILNFESSCGVCDG